jgi:hypothetical protein
MAGYCIGHNSCKYAPFLFKIGSNEAYLQGLPEPN